MASEPRTAFGERENADKYGSRRVTDRPDVKKGSRGAFFDQGRSCGTHTSRGTHLIKGTVGAAHFHYQVLHVGLAVGRGNSLELTLLLVVLVLRSRRCGGATDAALENLTGERSAALPDLKRRANSAGFFENLSWS